MFCTYIRDSNACFPGYYKIKFEASDSVYFQSDKSHNATIWLAQY